MRKNPVAKKQFYNDPAHKVQILLDPDETRGEVFFPEAAALSREKGYTLRLVSTREALAEKLRILEAGLCDKVLELLKAAHLPEVTGSYAGSGITRLRFSGQDEKYLRFDAMAGETPILHYAILQKEYLQYAEALQPYLHLKETPGRYIRVDETFASTPRGRYFLKKLP